MFQSTPLLQVLSRALVWCCVFHSILSISTTMILCWDSTESWLAMACSCSCQCYKSGVENLCGLVCSIPSLEPQPWYYTRTAQYHDMCWLALVHIRVTFLVEVWCGLVCPIPSAMVLWQESVVS